MPSIKIKMYFFSNPWRKYDEVCPIPPWLPELIPGWEYNNSDNEFLLVFSISILSRIITFEAVWLTLVSMRLGVIKIRKRFSSDDDFDKLFEIFVDRINKYKKKKYFNLI